MRRREWALSAFFVAVIGLQIAEAVWRLDAWPLSTVSMFSRRIAPTTPVRHVTLVGTFARGDTAELSAMHFGLTPDQFGRRLPADVRFLGIECGALGRSYNERQRFPGLRLTALRADVVVLQRPGMPPPALPKWSVDCPLGPK
jgi:hypothetical protein